MKNSDLEFRPLCIKLLNALIELESIHSNLNDKYRDELHDLIDQADLTLKDYPISVNSRQHIRKHLKWISYVPGKWFSRCTREYSYTRIILFNKKTPLCITQFRYNHKELE